MTDREITPVTTPDGTVVSGGADRLGAGAVDRLADPAEDEHVVVHREAEQDHEQEQRHHRVDPGG